MTAPRPHITGPDEPAADRDAAAAPDADHGTDPGAEDRPDPFDRIAPSRHAPLPGASIFARLRRAQAPARATGTTPESAPRHADARDELVRVPGVPDVIRPPDPAANWAALAGAVPDAGALERARLAGADGALPDAAANFDVLRTRMLQVLSENGWSRVAVTAPTRGCGTSFVTASLALSLARLHSVRSILLDLELRAPALADLFGIRPPGPIGDLLRGRADAGDRLLRVGSNLALGLNDTPEPEAAALLHDPETANRLTQMEAALQPTALLIDLPPMLTCDDVVAALPLVDTVLLVADGTRTLARDIAACERLLEGRRPVLGVVLNRATDHGRRYRYDGG